MPERHTDFFDITDPRTGFDYHLKMTFVLTRQYDDELGPGGHGVPSVRRVHYTDAQLETVDFGYLTLCRPMAVAVFGSKAICEVEGRVGEKLDWEDAA